MKYLITLILGTIMIFCLALPAFGDIDKEIENVKAQLNTIQWEFKYISERQKTLSMLAMELQKALRELEEKKKSEKSEKSEEKGAEKGENEVPKIP